MSTKLFSTTYNASLPRPALSISEQLSREPQMTHDSPQNLQIDLEHLVKLIETIFQNAAAAAAAAADASMVIDDNLINRLETLDGMRQALDDIRSISCEMSCNLSAGNVDEMTIELLQRLENYSWHAQVVLAMAAFASNIGELSMLVKHRKTDPIAKSVDILKGHSTVLDFSKLKSLGLFEAMMDVVNTNWELSKLPISMTSEEAIDLFSSATYKILHVVLKIASILSRKTGDYIESIRWEKEKLVDINGALLEYYKKEAETKAPRQYEDVTKRISKISISTLISKIKYYMKIEAPEKEINKPVLFLISALEIPIEEIKVLNLLYTEQMDAMYDKQKYEIVWLPILDLSTYDTKLFSELKQMMKWIVVEPTRIEPEVIQFIKNEWHFIKQAIAVSVSVTDEVTCQNALPMLWTWGNSAFPFTYEKEQILWNKIDEQSGWTLDLLLDQRVKNTLKIEKQEFVCLFGGGDISWIQEFTKKVKGAAYAAGVVLKMVYVGKSKGKGLARKELGREINVIESEFQWQFWSRLESILYAKIRQEKTVTANQTDMVMQEALKVVGYGGKGEAWAMFSRESEAMVTTNGEMALTIMSNYDNWGQEKAGIHFFEALKKYKNVISQDVHGCIDVHLPVLGQIPGIILCPECSKVMEMFYTYRCCAE